MRIPNRLQRNRHQNTFAVATTIAILCGMLSPSVHAETYKLYYLGGQSNMDGYGRVAELPQELASGLEDVMIFHGNTSPDKSPVDGRGVWSTLRPGHGVGFKSDGKKNTYSNRFGVELTFARKLRQLNPNDRIAIIKYSRGGTSLDRRAAGNFGCWEPDFKEGNGQGQGVNQYDHFLATMRHAASTRDIDGDGEADTLVPAGILWMQGESDATQTVEIARGYEHNLKRIIDLIRAAMRADDVPVAIGRISDSGSDKTDGKTWDFGDEVRSAQKAFVEKDEAAALVTSTDNYGYSDPWHYDSKGYIDLGRKFAEALQSINK